MSDRVEERRRAVRAAARGGFAIQRVLDRPVRLVEISMSGAFMRALGNWTVGERGELRTTLGDTTFVAHVEVRRVVSESAQTKGEGGCRIGVAFVSLDPRDRHCLERFLRQPVSS